VPEWRTAYIDYKALKKKLSAVRDGQEPDGSTRSFESGGSHGGALSHGSSDGSLRDLAGAVRGFLRAGGGAGGGVGGAGSERGGSRPGSPTVGRRGRGGGAGARPRGAAGLIAVRWSHPEDGTPQSRVPQARAHARAHTRAKHACAQQRACRAPQNPMTARSG
jgi:hypothetical protein